MQFVQSGEKERIFHGSQLHFLYISPTSLPLLTFRARGMPPSLLAGKGGCYTVFQGSLAELEMRKG